MRPPEDVGSVASDALVVRIAGLGRSEWRMLCDHDEQDHARGEQVSLLALVWLVKMDLRRHVVQGSQLRVQESTTVAALNGASESKISDF